jgi:ankyrin repeat protein
MNTFAALFVAFAVALPAPESPVADAARAGDIETVRALLRDGADANAAQGDGMTALHWSALNDDVAMVRILLYAGATAEATTRLGGYTPLHLAARAGYADVAQALLDGGSNPHTLTTTGVTALHFAAESGDPAVVRTLIERGAEVDARESYAGRTPLMFATARNRLDAISVLLESGADVSLATDVRDYVAMAKEDSRDRARRERIQKAARDPEPQAERPDRGQQPRQPAQPAPGLPAEEPDSVAAAAPDSSTTGETVGDSVVTDTLQHRERLPTTDPPEPDTATAVARTGPPSGSKAPRPLSYTDLVGKQGGMSALHYAVRDGQADAASLLLEGGADVNQLTLGDHSTPLLVAVINGNYDLAVTLLDAGADPNLTSEDGAAPLFATLNNEWALRTWYPQPTAQQQQNTSYLDLMEALLEAGADPNARVNTHIWYAAYNAGRMGVDFAGATAFWRAAYATDVPAMKLLVSYGADPNIRTTKPAGRSRFRRQVPDTTEIQDSTATEEDPSGLPVVPVGGPAVHPLHAASGVGYGTSRVGQQHRHVPDGWLPAVKYLVEELGVDPNVRDHEGYSAVHHAAARGDNEVIEFLVAYGADVTTVSRRGQTTVDMANGPQQRVQPFPETIALLESLGATNNNNCLSC